MPEVSADAPPTAQDGRSTRWDGHKAQRRVEVIDAAIAEIEATGTEFSVKQIAERLGLPRPVVYRHFADRADLDRQIRSRILAGLMAELMPTLQPDGTVSTAVRAVVETYVGWIVRHPRLHYFLRVGPRRRGNSAPVLAGARDQIGGRLTDLFAAALMRFGVDTATARPMAFGHIGLVDGVVNSWRADPDSRLTSAQIVDVLTESILVLIEGNARTFGVPVDRDSVVGELLAVSSGQRRSRAAS